MKKVFNKEVLRFVVVGFAATFVDLIINYLFVFILPEKMVLDLKSALCTTLGFIGGVIVNYIFSVTWVFQDVTNKGDAKSKKSFFKFVILSAFGLLLGVAFMDGFGGLALNSFGVDIYNWKAGNLASIFANLGKIFVNPGFWLFTLFFCIKTLIVLIYNYISRKKYIFK